MRPARLAPALCGAAILLVAIAWRRGGEYDEFYSVFLVAGHPRPDWPALPFGAGAARAFYRGHAGFGAIATACGGAMCIRRCISGCCRSGATRSGSGCSGCGCSRSWRRWARWRCSGGSPCGWASARPSRSRSRRCSTASPIPASWRGISRWRRSARWRGRCWRSTRRAAAAPAPGFAPARCWGPRVSAITSPALPRLRWVSGWPG